MQGTVHEAKVQAEDRGRHQKWDQGHLGLECHISVGEKGQVRGWDKTGETSPVSLAGALGAIMKCMDLNGGTRVWAETLQEKQVTSLCLLGLLGLGHAKTTAM